MADFESIISNSGIPEGYRFQQTDSQITLFFDVPIGTDPSTIRFDISPFENSICISLPDHPTPAICGIMYGPISDPQVGISSTLCQVQLRKVERGIWPLFITAPAPFGIDPKSLFMLAVKDDASGLTRAAWLKFEQAAELGYSHAKFVIATALLNDGNPYQMPRDLPRGIALLESIPAAFLTPEIEIVRADALIEIGDLARARQVLSDASQHSNEAKLKFVKFLDTLPDPGGEIGREAAGYLTELASDDVPEACHLLAKRYAIGKGVSRDVERAEQLAARAHALDAKFAETVEELESVRASPVVVGAGALVVLCFAAGIGFLRWKK
jgi:hypothetical protein